MSRPTRVPGPIWVRTPHQDPTPEADDYNDGCPMRRPPRVPATCPGLDDLAAIIRQAGRRQLTREERRRALALIEWQRGAHSELRALAGYERDQRQTSTLDARIIAALEALID